MIFLKNSIRKLQNIRFLLLPLSLGVILAASACSAIQLENPFTGWFGGDERPDRSAILSDVTLLNVDMYDSYYGDDDTNLTNPPIWNVKAGADVVVNLVNHGSYNHNWAIVKQGAQVPVPYEEGQAGDILLHGIGMVYGNSQTTITFTAPDAGEYQIICTVSGHYPLMQGRLEVTDDGKVAGD